VTNHPQRPVPGWIVLGLWVLQFAPTTTPILEVEMDLRRNLSQRRLALEVTRRSFLSSFAGSVLLANGSLRDSAILLKTPQGGLQPQAVVDSSGVIHLVYLYGDPSAADIAYVKRAPSEQDFSAPIRVNTQPGTAIALGTVRGAHIALGRSGRVHVTWNGSSTAEPKGPQKSSPLLYARIDDRGQSFEPQRNLMQTATGLDGGGAVAADLDGNVYVTWHAQGQRNAQPIEGEGHRRAWIAHSMDNGKTFDRERPVSPPGTGACGCCGMGALADSDGNLYLLYRSAREIVHRDMYLLISRDRGRTFKAMDLHPWQIGACPMSTVSLALAKGRVLLSWETEKQVYFASVDVRTGAIGEPIAAPGANRNRKHPAIASNQRGEILLVWTEGTGWKKGGSLKWQVFDSYARLLTPGDEGAVVPAWGLATAVTVRSKFVVIC
jgi:hypothetical protein